MKPPPRLKLTKPLVNSQKSGVKSCDVRSSRAMKARKTRGNSPHLSKFTKHDGAKSRLDLLPPYALEFVGHVLGHGAKIYAPGNWKKCKDPERYIAAGLRHYMKHMKGEFLDKDSGFPHLSCVAVNALFALDLILNQGQDSYTMGNYFALVEKKGKKRGVVRKRFANFSSAWEYLEDHELDVDKHVIKTVPAKVKVGATTKIK